MHWRDTLCTFCMQKYFKQAIKMGTFASLFIKARTIFIGEISPFKKEPSNVLPRPKTAFIERKKRV